MKAKSITIIVLAALAAAAGLVSCGGGGDSEDSAGGGIFGGNNQVSRDDERGDYDVCLVPERLPLKEKGKLIVAINEDVSFPWVDQGVLESLNGAIPEDILKEAGGFEAAVAYQIADWFELEEVEWATVRGNEALSSGEKGYDFSIQQHVITSELEKIVDFSISYYEMDQVLVALENSAISRVTGLLSLRDAKFGVLSDDSRAEDYIQTYIKPSEEVKFYESNQDVFSAFINLELDGFITDLSSAYSFSEEFPGAEIVGILPKREENLDNLGLLAEQGSPLIPCLNTIITDMKKARLDSFVERHLLGKTEGETTECKPERTYICRLSRT